LKAKKTFGDEGKKEAEGEPSRIVARGEFLSSPSKVKLTVLGSTKGLEARKRQQRQPADRSQFNPASKGPKEKKKQALLALVGRRGGRIIDWDGRWRQNARR